MPRKLCVPRVSIAVRDSVAGADPRDQGVALGEGLGICAPIGRARRPERGDKLIEVGATQRRHAL